MDRLAPKVRLTIASCLAALGLGTAHAALPDSGWYWNPAEDGRGFNIEIQDDKIFMSAFAYKPDGSPVWYVAGGPMTSDRSWSADVYETAYGQPIGGAYRPAALIPLGRASITFTSEKTAQVTLLGTTVYVQRQDWSGYATHHPQALLGEWSTSEGDPSFPVYYSDRVILNTKGTLPSGEPHVSGFRTGTSPSRYPAVGVWEPENQVFGILVDSSTSYYTLYVFNMTGLNRAEGLKWTYKKGTSPTGSGTYFLANRTKSGARVQGRNAPGVVKDARADAWPVEVDRDALDAVRAAHPAAKASVESDEAEGITRPALDARAVQQLDAELKARIGR